MISIINTTKPETRLVWGFTLVEVMVALAIVSVALVSIFTAFGGISDTLARVDNYNRSCLIGIEKLWELEEAMLKSPEVRSSDFSGELKDERRSFRWEFESKELESYPTLREINLNLHWQQGKRSGDFQAGTYLRIKPTE